MHGNRDGGKVKIRSPLRQFSIVVLLLCLSASMWGGCNEWTTNGPWGGGITSLAVDPKMPTTVYAGTWGAGIFKSRDGGATWGSTGKIPSESGPYIVTLAIDPVTPSVLYAGTAGGMEKSTDGGSSWTPLSFPHPGEGVNKIAIDPTANSTIYAGSSHHGMFKTIDAGSTWSRINAGFPSSTLGNTVVVLAIVPQTPQTLYAVTTDMGPKYYLSKSTDGGESWVETWSREDGIFSLMVDPHSPQILYAGTGGGVFKSTNEGKEWTAASYGLPGDAGVETFAADPIRPEVLYAGTFGKGVYKTYDGGASWQVSGLKGMVSAIAIPLLPPFTLYCSTDTGVYTSTDEGASWAYANVGIPLIGISSAAAHPKDSGVLYIGTFGRGVFQSTDGGATWEEVNHGLPMISNSLHADIVSLAINPLDPATLYCSPADPIGLYKTTDGGASWVPANHGLPPSYFAKLIFDPSSPDTLYAAGNGLYKTCDGGDSWSLIGVGLPSQSIYDLAIDPSNPQVLFAGVQSLESLDGGVFKSADAGASWSRVYDGCGIPIFGFSVAIDPRTPSTVYASVRCGIIKSTDGGVTWEIINENLGIIALDQLDPANIYFAGGVEGFLKSPDAGLTWKVLSRGFPDRGGYCSLVNPGTPTIVYFGAVNGLWSITQAPWFPADCNENGEISIGEVQKAINIFLGLVPPACGVDRDGDGTVTIGEMQTVINGFLGLEDACSLAPIRYRGSNRD